jgi:hypothetical protein
MLFEHVDSAGVRYVPREFSSRSYRTVQPSWFRRESNRYNEANSADVLFDRLRRGFHVWMVTVDGRQTKLVSPAEVVVRFSAV